jgi:hypothetical protein
MRELTSAELDVVCGGTGMVGGCNTGTTYFATSPKPTSGGCNLVEEIIADILKILDSNNCNSGPVKARLA